VLVSNNIKQLHNIRASTKILKDFNFSFDLQQHERCRLKSR